MTAVEELKDVLDDVMKSRGIFIAWDAYLSKEKAQTINFATNFARDYIGFDSVSTDPNAASPAEHYYNQTFKK